MAGDWIKMRVDLADDPAVLKIAERLRADPDLIVGKLHRLWSWASVHLRNGFAAGLTGGMIDTQLKQEGFSNAMMIEKWLEITEEGVRFPRWERHNSKSAKSRALASTRKERWRNAKGTQRASRARGPEKRREEKSKEPPFPPSLDTPEFRTAWERWRTHRNEIRRPLTPTSVSRAFAAMTEWGPARACAAIDHSIVHGWRGIFEADGRSNGHGHAPGGRRPGWDNPAEGAH